MSVGRRTGVFMKNLKIAVVLLLLFAGRPLFGMEIADSLGRTVHFEQPPQRIVIAGRGLLMVADAVYLFPEARKRVVGIEKISQGRDSFLSILDPGYDERKVLPFDVGPEKIASMHPDVVLLKSYMRHKLGRRLERLGISVLYLDLETPLQYTRDILTLGRLFDNENRAREIIAFYEARLKTIEDGLAEFGAAERPGTLLLYYDERGGNRAFNVPPRTWMQTILVERAGGRPVWSQMKGGGGWTKVSFEQIAAWDAEYIFVTSYFTDASEVVAQLNSDPLWKSLHAVQNGRLYPFPADYFSWDQPDPRWILGLTWLAVRLHPEKFAHIDIAEEARIFFRDLYFLDEEDYFKYIYTLLQDVIS
jgi:iron complex transport system substrate-binding protein